MNYICLREQEEEFLDQFCLDTMSSEQSNGKNTHAKSLNNGRGMDTSSPSLFSRWTSETLTDALLPCIEKWLRSFRLDSRANPGVTQINQKNMGNMIPVTCGLRQLSRFASYDQGSHSWRMFQGCFIDSISDEFSGIWPKQGTMRDGVCWEARLSIQPAMGKDSGYSLMRPIANNWKGWTFIKISGLVRKHHGDGNLMEQSARCFRKMITPESNEILMLWPKGWTDLKPLAMDRFHSWRQMHSEFFRRD